MNNTRTCRDIRHWKRFNRFIRVRTGAFPQIGLQARFVQGPVDKEQRFLRILNRWKPWRLRRTCGARDDAFCETFRSTFRSRMASLRCVWERVLSADLSLKTWLDIVHTCTVFRLCVLLDVSWDLPPGQSVWGSGDSCMASLRCATSNASSDDGLSWISCDIRCIRTAFLPCGCVRGFAIRACSQKSENISCMWRAYLWEVPWPEETQPMKEAIKEILQVGSLQSGALSWLWVSASLPS